jgi:threonine aldolase
MEARRPQRLRQFASDNQSGICPEAWEALARANADHCPSYGRDALTQRAADLVRELFDTDCDVYFLFNGTAANSLALASLGRSYQAAICHEDAHVHTSECGAPQFFSGGMKLLTCPGAAGKLDPAALKELVVERLDIHRAQPRVLSITQATEMGTVYTPAEVRALSDIARDARMRVHMDGARFFNAAASLGCAPAEITWKAGVDVLTLGGTKNGMAMAEAVVFFDGALGEEFGYRCLQGGQVASKMRFMTAQWVGVLESAAWRRHATHANAMASRLATALRDVRDVRLLFPVQSNAVFADMSPALQQALRERGWSFFPFVGERGVRLMCSWDTTESDVDQLAADVKTWASVS